MHKTKQYVSQYVCTLDNTLDSNFKYVSIRSHLNSQRPEKKIKIDHITPILSVK